MHTENAKLDDKAMMADPSDVGLLNSDLVKADNMATLKPIIKAKKEPLIAQ